MRSYLRNVVLLYSSASLFLIRTDSLLRASVVMTADLKVVI